MVNPKLVGCGQGLRKGEVRLACRVDLDIRRTGSRDDLVRGNSEGENVGDMSYLESQGENVKRCCKRNRPLSMV